MSEQSLLVVGLIGMFVVVPLLICVEVVALMLVTAP